MDALSAAAAVVCIMGVRHLRSRGARQLKQTRQQSHRVARDFRRGYVKVHLVPVAKREWIGFRAAIVIAFLRTVKMTQTHTQTKRLSRGEEEFSRARGGVLAPLFAVRGALLGFGAQALFCLSHLISLGSFASARPAGDEWLGLLNRFWFALAEQNTLGAARKVHQSAPRISVSFLVGTLVSDAN
jgi:hypothetical protein